MELYLSRHAHAGTGGVGGGVGMTVAVGAGVIVVVGAGVAMLTGVTVAVGVSEGAGSPPETQPGSSARMTRANSPRRAEVR